MESLTQVVYLSSASHLFQEAELEELLKQARQRNTELGITGLLLYADGNFIQALEGEVSKIAEVMGSIENDQRHHGVLVLLNELIDRREFPDWSMGYRKLSALECSGFSDFFEGDRSSHQKQILAGKAKKLLASFCSHT